MRWRSSSSGATTRATTIAASGPVTTAATTTTAASPQGDGDGPATTAAPGTTAAPPTTMAPDVSVPVGAVGAFTVATGQTPVVGTGGLVTYTVEVEDAVGYSVDEFARIVDATLADPRSWTADGSVAFQRVAAGGQVRIVLATPATVDGLCLPLNTAGIYSCHQGGTVALNSNRWLNGTENWPGPTRGVPPLRREPRGRPRHRPRPRRLWRRRSARPGDDAAVQGLEGCLPNGWPNP